MPAGHPGWGRPRMPGTAGPAPARFSRFADVRALPCRHRGHRIQPADPALQRPPRRHRQPPDPALPDDLLIDRRHRTALPRQIPGPDHLQQQRLDLLRNPAPATTATRPARKQIRHHPRTRPPPRQQPIHLAARDPQLRRRLIRYRHPSSLLPRQPTDHLSPPHSHRPLLRRSRQHTQLRHTVDHTDPTVVHTSTNEDRQ